MANRTLLRHRGAPRTSQTARVHKLLFETLERREVLAAGPVVISEFMAVNDSTLADAQGDRSDWIEIHNPTDAPVELAGWYLTDDADDLTKWQFPDLSLAPGEHMVVFASGKDRAVAGAELHTNFQLDGEGEYLALVQDDGATIASHFAPEYPEQFDDVSYGMTQDGSALSLEGAGLNYLVPTIDEEALGTTWTEIGFDDSGWTAALRMTSVLITEIGTATDFVEVQNVSEEAVSTSGWTVWANDANDASGAAEINAYHDVPWNLPDSLAAGELRYGIEVPDEIGGDPWNTNVFWRTEGSGWAVLLDDAGSVADFVVWGYGLDEIAEMDVTIAETGTHLSGVEIWNGEAAPRNIDDPRLEYSLQRSGEADHDDKFDWNPVTPMSKGAENDGLRTPFSIGAALGLGFEMNPPGLGRAVDVDVEDVMHNVNASLWTRTPFYVDDPSAFYTLQLRVQYNDGFVAYINGQEVARENAPDLLHWDSSAMAPRSVEDSLQVEVIDLSAQLPVLQAGANVFAIHGLNVATDDGNVLILPELTVSSFRYLDPPTPGEPNGIGFLGCVRDTRFSVDRGFLEESSEVEITTPTADATIYYTLDGSVPTKANGIQYAGPIVIDSTTTLRAAAYKEGYRPTNVDTQTYLFLDDVIRQPATVAGYPTPTVNTGHSQSVRLDFEMDPDVVDDPAYSSSILDGLRSIPTVSVVAEVDDMFGSGGVYFDGGGSSSGPEKPVSVEFLFPDNPDANLQAEAGMRPHSHKYLKRSLRLLFRNQYGDAKLRGEIFAGAPLEADSAADVFDRLVLRAGGNRNFVNYWNPDDSTYTRDEWARASQIATSGVGSHGTFVHLYLNGLYWGLYNLVERPDHFFAATYYGGDQDDYYAVNHGGSISGDSSRWDYLKGPLKNKDMSIPANYEELQEYLDVAHFSDYLLLNWYAGTADWPQNNWYGSNRNTPEPGPLRFFGWDAEDIFDDEGSSGPFDQWGGRGNDGAWVEPKFRASQSGATAIDRIWHSARRSQEFMTLFADRAYKHLFNDGALTDENSQARWQALNDYVSDPIIGESARWGDARGTYTGESGLIRTRDGVWQSEANRVLTQSLPGNAQQMIVVLRAEGYYPDLDPPQFSQHGGQIPPGFQLAASNPNASGKIYFTTDDSDPRLVGGDPSPTATIYTGPVTLERNTRVKARVLDGGQWSALAEAAFLLDAALPLRITEIMYRPAPPTPEETAAGFTDREAFEFVELLNVGSGVLNLDGVRFADGVDFTFGDVDLAPGQYTVVAANEAAFEMRYGLGVPVVGGYDRQWDNGGEHVRLEGRLGETILDFDYDDAWYPITDGDGYSLVIVDAGADPNTWGDPARWRPSWQLGGSPGTSESGISPGAVVINEVLSHTSLPDGDFIELHNTTAEPIDIGGWFLSDDPAEPMKYRIAELAEVSAGGFAVWTQAANFGVGSGDPGALIPFDLSELGDELHLASAEGDTLTGYRESIAFEAAAGEVTFGRFPTSTGAVDFPALSVPTPRNANAEPLPGTVVLNEIMYNPAGGGEEYIELHNPTGQAVPLYDPQNPSNTWRLTDGVDFGFPADVTIPAGRFALVVPITPADFRTAYGVPPEVPIFGPYFGALANNGEEVALSRPGDPEPGGMVPYIVVDRVEYDDRLPWYPQADGGGSALARLDPNAYGNDVAHWVPSTSGGTPGAENVTIDVTPPTMPENLVATVVSSAQIDLQWNASIDLETGVAEYRVYRNGVIIGSGPNTSFSDHDAEAATSYTYEVSAVNPDGAESVRSTSERIAIMAIETIRVPDAREVHVLFSEPLDTASAENHENYQIDGIDLFAASLRPDGRTVVLSTSTIKEGQTHVLTVANLVGLGGGRLPLDTAAEFTRSSRVTDGLVLLYDLEEGSGNVVHDVSGFGDPLDLSIADPGAVDWMSGGLSVDSATVIASAVPAGKVIDAVTATDAITVEAWVLPAAVGQSGPARIVTLSADTGNRNFTLGQDLDGYDVRLRTTATSYNGIPSLPAPGQVQTTELAHLVYTRDAAGSARIYVDNVEAASGTVVGDLSNWSSDYRFAMANEFTNDRPWRGEIHLAAVYDRALGPEEVEQNYLAGADPLLPEPAVVGRHVFYNDSTFDGYDAAANAADDRAIAPDKQALLPGETATFAHYTSYALGLNGIMVDIDSLPGVPELSDFQFRTGNDDTPGAWIAAPDPTSITVRSDEGVGGSDRVTIIWSDAAVAKQWLQVTVLATPTTGLAADNVFYFGNAIGETGNSTTDAKVTAADMLGARDNQRSFLDPAPIDFPFDFDRDALVKAVDMLIGRNNQTHFLNALKLITVPDPEAAKVDAGKAEHEPAHDLILQRATQQETSPAELNWVHEFEEPPSRDRSADKHNPSSEPVEALLVSF